MEEENVEIIVLDEMQEEEFSNNKGEWSRCHTQV